MSTYKVFNGDCLDHLEFMASDSVQTCITSPPYFGLRDYGVEGQIGLEETPEEYVRKMVEVFREVRRILKPDGTLWLNLGDSYAGAGPSGASYQSETTKKRAEMRTDGAFRISKTLAARGLTYADKKPVAPPGYKKKDLLGIPWMVAFALRADGWYLRQDIIWHKPNPMPEAVKDRCTKAHEYIFLLTKSQKYYFDHEAMREPAVKGPQRMQANPETARRRSVGPMARGEEGFNHQYADSERIWAADGKRNRRSVWTVTTKPYKGAHFATYPSDLIEPCLLAGSREGDQVLDPFTGSGTTAQVALSLGRRFIGTELNPEYMPLIEKRIQDGLGKYDEL